MCPQCKSVGQYYKHDNGANTSTEEETLLVGVRLKGKVNWPDSEGQCCINEINACTNP